MMESAEYTTGVLGRDLFERLREIERILAPGEVVPAPGGGEVDAVALHLADVPSGRIRELTSTLRQRPAETLDEIDAVTMRLLLNDYAVAVAHLRAVARASAARIDAASIPVRESQRFVRIDDRRNGKQESHHAAPGAGEPPAAGPSE